MAGKVKHRRRGATRISSKNQVTIPVDALARAGLASGDVLTAKFAGPGRIVLERDIPALDELAGALTGVYGDGYLDDLRREWR